MKKSKELNVRNLCMIAGCTLITIALVWAVVWNGSASVYEKRCQEYAEKLLASIPPVKNSVSEERADNTMPILSADKIDFVALIECPAYDSVLPVSNDWGTPNKYPCRFIGSVYDGTLVIGSTDRIGQMDFSKDLSVGDAIYVTDMTGSRYGYRVSDIIISSHADKETLCRSDADMTVFIKNSMAFEYRIIRCNFEE